MQMGDQFPVIPDEGILTEGLTQDIYFCGNKQEFRLDGRLYPLPSLVWTWWLDGRFPGMAQDKAEATLQAAFATWSKPCRHTPRQAATRDSANVLITVEHIDGDSSVLADAQLYTGQRQQKMRFDLEKWVAAFNPGNGWIGLPHVAAHEWGHIIGLTHLQYDGTPDLMNPTYSPSLWTPQEDESSIVLKLYGAPETPPPPVPPAGPRIMCRMAIAQGDREWLVEGEAKRIK